MFVRATSYIAHPGRGASESDTPPVNAIPLEQDNGPDVRPALVMRVRFPG